MWQRLQLHVGALVSAEFWHGTLTIWDEMKEAHVRVAWVVCLLLEARACSSVLGAVYDGHGSQEDSRGSYRDFHSH